jgi:hypothetical protein
VFYSATDLKEEKTPEEPEKKLEKTENESEKDDFEKELEEMIAQAGDLDNLKKSGKHRLQ